MMPLQPKTLKGIETGKIGRELFHQVALQWPKTLKGIETENLLLESGWRVFAAKPGGFSPLLNGSAGRVAVRQLPALTCRKES
jgi:hypothetical protein